jgi:hypothetical protein
MKKLLGWVVVIALVLLVGTHPGSAAGLLHMILAVLRSAGNELGTFVSKL